MLRRCLIHRYRPVLTRFCLWCAQKCVRNGYKPYLKQELGQARVSHGTTLVVIAWWVKYAEETAERLPDSNKLMTPCRQLACRVASAHPPARALLTAVCLFSLRRRCCSSMLSSITPLERTDLQRLGTVGAVL